MELANAPPNRPSDGTAAEDFQLAQKALVSALLAGADTGPARTALEEARKAATAERNAADQAARAAVQADHAAAKQAEAETIEQAQDQVADAIGTIEAAPDTDPLPEPVESPIVKIAAQHLAQAHFGLAKADVPHAAAIAERDALRARLEPKSRELESIRARRSAGDEQPGDAANMTALSMDVEDLGRMLVPLEAAVVAAAPVAQQHAVAAAEAALVAAKRRAEVDGMVERVRMLEAHFAAQVRTLRLAAAERGMNNLGSIYQPSDALRKVANGAWV